MQYSRRNVMALAILEILWYGNTERLLVAWYKEAVYVDDVMLARSENVSRDDYWFYISVNYDLGDYTKIDNGMWLQAIKWEFFRPRFTWYRALDSRFYVSQTFDKWSAIRQQFADSLSSISSQSSVKTNRWLKGKGVWTGQTLEQNYGTQFQSVWAP